MMATPFLEILIDGKVAAWLGYDYEDGWQLVSTEEGLKKDDKSSAAYRKYGLKIFELALEKAAKLYPKGE
jgi:hypothetical protein